MNIFYTPHIQNNEARLIDEEARHVQVLRKKEGELLYITDGKGRLYSGIIQKLGKKEVSLFEMKLKEEKAVKSQKLHIAIAPTKNISRFEWFLEKVTEIGIDSITPIICDHSERRVIKPERLKKILISAMKQSLSYSLPVLHPVQNIAQFLPTVTKQTKFIAHGHSQAKELYEFNQDGKDVLICIGPEGDFSAEELKMAHHHQFRLLSLGESRLRTETAGVVACHSFHIWRKIAKKMNGS